MNLRDEGDPVVLAERYEAQGADEIVYLDISATNDRRSTLLDLVRRTAEQLFIPLTVGGGMRSVEDIAAALRERARAPSCISPRIHGMAGQPILRRQ